MPLLKKQWKCLSTSVLFAFLLLLPKHTTIACIGFIPDEDFRVALWQPSALDSSGHLEALYFSLDVFGKNKYGYVYASAIELNQNYLSWRKALQQQFSKPDFDTAMSILEYQSLADTNQAFFTCNSFIKALRQPTNQAFWTYFTLAKSAERFNSFNAYKDPWGLDSVHSYAESQTQLALAQLLNTTKHPFIQERCAYLLCRLFHYGHQPHSLDSVYKKYLNKPRTTPWIKAAAEYYVTMTAAKDSNRNSAYDDYLEPSRTRNYIHNANFYRHLLHVVSESPDKRLAAIRVITRDSLQHLLPLLPTKKEKALAHAVFAVKNQAHCLAALQKIIQLDPYNKLLPLLLSREINKVEAYLLTPALMGKEAQKEEDYFIYNYGVEKGSSQKERAYAQQLLALVSDISTNGIIQPAEKYLAISHLHLMLHQYDQALSYCTKAMNLCAKTSTYYLQARINMLAIRLQQQRKLDEPLKEQLYQLLTFMDAQHTVNKALEDNYVNYYNFNPSLSIKDDLCIYLGKTLLAFGDVVNAALLLGNTNKPWGVWMLNSPKNVYTILYEHAKGADFEQLLKVLRAKKHSHYEQYCINRLAIFYDYGNYGYETGDSANLRKQISNTNYGQLIPLWDTFRVHDLQGIYYLKQDNIAAALHSFKQVAPQFWTDSAHAFCFYLTGNPFEVNIYHPNEDSQDSTYKNDPNKAHFLEKLMHYKALEAKETNMEKKARLCYIIGNAYFSMGSSGKFWLMTNLSSYETYESPKATYYYQKAARLAKDAKQAAFYAMYANCRHGYIDPEHLNTRLTSQKDGAEWLKRLVHECPLYADFFQQENKLVAKIL